tara:strand:- start:86 stop:1609 length:1524 start_codon:yes stop_codon:yes gene_type:complete
MNRTELLARLADRSVEWDVLVIGGGATGLGIALDAASRGYRTALLEGADFAEGTSSRSTKLIHGGVRYLRGGEVGLVRESLRERGRLLHNAAGLVKPLAFVVPAYRWYERFFYGVGLTLYDVLAGSLGIESTGHLSAADSIREVPNLSNDGLRGATQYWDGQFDDARLAIALAMTAVKEGATVVNHVKVEELIQESGKVSGVAAVDQLDGTEYRVRARVVINATGVFSDSVRRMDNPDAGDIMTTSQGMHLVLDREFLGGDTAVMIPSTDDGRVLFAIPWYNRVILGTTDTGGVAVDRHPAPLDSEIDYLLEHMGRYLVKTPERSDIKAAFAGLRPLVRPRGDSGATSKISRSHQILVSEKGLLTVAGGKWTTYRQMAEEAVDKACTLGGLGAQPCLTRDLPLLHSGPVKGDLLDAELPYTLGDIDRGLKEEMAMTLDDLLSRRTRSLLLDSEAVVRIAPLVAKRMAEHFDRDDHWVESEFSRFRRIAAAYKAPTSQRPSSPESEGS